METRPLVRAFIARPRSNGQVGAIQLVSLSTAYLAMHDGFVVVGPDPGDLDILAQWEREQAGSNPPRLSEGE